MKKVICIFLCIILLLVFLIGIYVLVIYIKDTCAIKNDTTLYEGFKIIEEKQITAEDGVEFFTVQVDMNNPKIPYRLYVFTSENKEKPLCFVDSYMHQFNPEVELIASFGNKSYYVIEDYIINNADEGFQTLAAGSLDALENTNEVYDEYVPVVKKLVEQGSWFWLYEGAEFLLKSEEKAYITEVLSNFETNNKEKTEYSEPYYRSTLTYEKMVSKCNELLQKYSGV